MARLPIQDPRTATGSNKQVFDGLQKALGMVPNMVKVMANSPAVLQAYTQFSGALVRAKLSPQIREQIAMLAAETNSCNYCLSAHSAMGKMAGLSQDQMDRARLGEANDPRAAAALRFAQAVLDTRGGVSDSDMQGVRRAGLSDGEIAEIVATIALNVFTNYFNRAFRTDIDFPRVEAHEHAMAS